MAYKRILLKISGEQLAGQYEGGFDPERAAWMAGEVKKAVNAGSQIVIMVGGGNYARGAQLAGHGIERVTADNIGMLGTVMNALALADVFNNSGLDSRAVSNIKADQVIDQFTHRRVLSQLEKNRVVLVAGGIGRPYLTTDTAAVSLALEIDCDVVLKATKVNGVFDSDPEKNPSASHLPELTHQQAVENEDIKVMDKAAMGLAMEHKMPIIVFELDQPDNIAKVAAGEKVGTVIS